MRRLAMVCALAGCTYAPDAAQLTGDGAPPGDTDPEPTPVAACTVGGNGIEVAASDIIGGDGGSNRAAAVCADGELPIGIGFDVSMNPITNHNNQVAMVNLHVRCGQLARGTDGVFHTTPTEVFDSNGGSGGNCAPYFPTVVASEVTCPSGKILVGVNGNRLDTTLYNTVSLVCADLSPEGTVTGTLTTLPIANTGSHSNLPMMSMCSPGTAISSFGIKSACGHDQLAPRCTPITCR